MKGGAFLMGRKSKYTIEEKVEAVLDYKSGKRGKAQICNDLGINHSRIDLYRWIQKYDKYGEEAFYPKRRNASYTQEFKEKIAREYLARKGSLRDLMIKHDICSDSTILGWIKMYNNHGELKGYNPKGEVYMIKNRKTTLEERKEIVQYCLDHNREYKLAAEHFDVSYTQVYQWVQKHEEYGEAGLQDGRGKRKLEVELDETERLKLKVARLERQLEESKMENILLKKVKEIERRRYSPKSDK